MIVSDSSTKPQAVQSVTPWAQAHNASRDIHLLKANSRISYSSPQTHTDELYIVRT
jgi:hypothetical protein